MILMLGAKFTWLWHFQFQTGLGLIWSIWSYNFNQCSHSKAHFNSLLTIHEKRLSVHPFSVSSRTCILAATLTFNISTISNVSKVNAHQSSSESETFSSLLETLVTTLHCTTAQCSLIIWLSNNVSTDGDSGAVCRQAALRGRLLQPH